MSSALHSTFCFSLFFLSICTLPLSGATIEGTVLLRDGTPAGGALVRIRPVDFIKDTSSQPQPVDSKKVKDVTADTNGVFRLDSIDIGRYNLEMELGSNSAAVFNVILPNANDKTVINSCRLQPSGVLRGRVGPVDLSINVFIAAYGFERLVKPDTTGEFRIVLPAGSYIFRIFSNNISSPILEAYEVVILSGDTTDIGFYQLPQIAPRFQPIHNNISFSIRKGLWKRPFISYDLKGRMQYRQKSNSTGIYLKAGGKRICLSDEINKSLE